MGWRGAVRPRALAVPQRPADQRRHDARVQGDAAGQLFAAQRQPAFAGQAHRSAGFARRRAAAGLDQPVALAHEGLAAGKGSRIVELHEDRRTPAFGRVGAAMAGQAGGQRFDEQRQPVTLVAGVEAAQRQDRARRLPEQHGRIIAGPAIRVEPPGVVAALAGRVQPVAHPVGRDRGRNVDHHRPGRGRDADRQRVRREHGPRAAERRDAGRGRVGAGDHRQQSVVGNLPQVSGQAGDVVAATDRHARRAAP